ncbi:hypothetical protein FACS1894195_0920 [Bacteroidia bacterium]|nr:hypothetical protein FACS1894195_0920 [Bacteroidia bacterium]
MARILLPMPILPERLDFSGKKEKNAELEVLAGDLPVVFTGSFQGASKYHFFTGKEAFVLSAIDRRQTQFDIWQKELQFQGKPVFVPQWGRAVESFQSVNRVKINYTLPRTEVQAGDTLMIPFEIHNPSTHAIDFGHPELPVTLKAAYILKRETAFDDTRKILFGGFRIAKCFTWQRGFR